MPANECIPYKEPGSAFTFKATADVTGKRFVAPSGNRTGGPGLSTDLANVYQCAHAGAGAHAVGVSKYDAANGSLGGAHTGGIVPVTAGAAIAAGQAVQSDATGQAIPLAAGVKLGVCLNGAAGGADAEILLSI
jgi:hypothetical protein